jgi:hypothetical protein
MAHNRAEGPELQLGALESSVPLSESQDANILPRCGDSIGRVLAAVEREAAAITYLRQGYRVIPVQPDRKEPWQEWSQLYKHGVSANDISRWFEAEPNMNIGLVAGRYSRIRPDGYFASLDIDYGDKSRSNGAVMPDWLVEAVKGLGTPVVRTPSGGCQVWVWVDYLDDAVNSHRDIGGVTIDLRVEKQNCLAPPSTVNGIPYRFDDEAQTELRHLESLLVELERLAPIAAPRPRNKRSTRLDTSLVPAWDGEVTDEGITALYAENEVVRKLLPLCRIPRSHINWRTGRSRTFRCPLHPDERPSATLTRSPSGQWTMKCPHTTRGSIVWLLPQLYAALNRAPKRVQGGPLALWSLRLLVAAKVLVPPTIKPPQIPDRLSQDAQRVLAGAVEVAALRLLSTGDIGPFPFAARFAPAWCGLSLRRYLRGMEELHRHGLFVKVDELPTPHKRPTYLYELRATRLA